MSNENLVPLRTVGAGCGILIGEKFGVSVALCLCGMTGEFQTKGTVTVRRKQGESWSFGDEIYWKESEATASLDPTDATFIGKADVAGNVVLMR